MTKPVILTDIDGVGIKWQSGLPYFAGEMNMPLDKIIELQVHDVFIPAGEIFGCNERLATELLKRYNNSHYIRTLQGYDDALEVINRMKKDFDFVAISSLGDTQEALLNRMYNLNTLFPGAFKDVMIVPHNESKTQHYLTVKIKHADNLLFFVDDLKRNLDDCHAVISKLPLIHMIRGEREEVEVPHYKVNNWYDIEKLAYEKFLPALRARQEQKKQPMATLEQIFCDSIPSPSAEDLQPLLKLMEETKKEMDFPGQDKIAEWYRVSADNMSKWEWEHQTVAGETMLTRITSDSHLADDPDWEWCDDANMYVPIRKCVGCSKEGPANYSDGPEGPSEYYCGGAPWCCP